MTTTATKRECAGETCRTLLNSYNTGDFCHACLKKQIDAQVLALREQMEKREADERARIEREGAPNGYTRDSLIEILRQMEAALGREPKTTDCGGDYPDDETFSKYFGSWVEAKRAAGISRKATTREKVMDSLREGPKTGKQIAGEIACDARYVSRLLAELAGDGWVKQRKQRRNIPGGFEFVYRLAKKDGGA